MTTGQTFGFDLDNGWIDNGQSVSVAMFDGSAQAAELAFVGGNANYGWTDSTSNGTGIGFTDGGLHVEVDVLGGGSYTVQVQRLSDSASYTKTGTFMNGCQNLTGFAFFNANAGPFSQRDAYLNNMTVVPEPASFLALGLGVPVLLRRRRR
ncbi:MAG: PEP-CTERM sorting domain-containing protein [Armatimonadetes bacterium]|nr:PEP-CTERM sorting domain-containing protein [Armatimonadota bacterium]